MEENVKIMLLGHQISIDKDSIINLKPIITQQTLRQIRLPYCISKFQPQINVLHSCLYYLITVDKNLKQSCCLEFREKCLLSISDYYIKHQMNFQLYEYGYLCAKILSIPIEKVMHILYFLIYTRLASKPYIIGLIAQIQKKGVQFRKKTITKSQKQPSLYSKSHESRHLTIFIQNSQIEADNLKRQLRNIMGALNKQTKKMTKKIQNKRYFNLKKIYPDDADLKDDVEGQQDRMFRSSATSRVITIPVKVRQNENSSIISRLKLRSGNNCSQETLKRIEVRRQKFNDWQQQTYKLEHLINDYDVKETRRAEWGTSKRIIDKDQKNTPTNYNKSQKHPYQYYQDIASSIRNKNDQLDSIRFECIHHNKKSTSNLFKQSFKYNSDCEKGFKLGRHLLKTETVNLQANSIKDQKGNKTNREFKENEVKQEKYLQGERDKDNCKLSKTASISKLSDNGIQDQLANIITRKNEITPVQDESFMLFNKKVKSKLKLQKYKQDYRHYLKNQIFQQFKETI